MRQKAVKTNRPRILERTLDPPAAVPESRPDAPAAPSALQSRAGHHIAIGRIVPAPPLPLQAKLEISEPGDPLEEEADRVADLVMRMPERDHAVGHELSKGAAGLQRMCDECESAEEGEEEERDENWKERRFEKVQRKEANRDAVDSVAFSQVMAVTQTGGQPLDAGTRAFMEPRFGFDFSTVRIHADGHAADAARSVNAQAYTLGTHVVFNAGRHSPDTSAGQWLLAHELAHVVQQHSPAHTDVHADRDAAGMATDVHAAAFALGHHIYFNRGRYAPATAAGKKLLAHELTHVIQQTAGRPPVLARQTVQRRVGGPTRVQRYSLRGFPATEAAAMHAAIPTAISKVKACSKLSWWGRRMTRIAIGDRRYDYKPNLGDCGWTFPGSWYIEIGKEAFDPKACCDLASTIAHEAAHTQLYTEGRARKLECNCFGCSC